MRMWMTAPQKMCRQHLLGEFRELYTFLGTFRLKRRIDGYIRNNLLEISSLESRWEELRKEMETRGWKPRKPFNYTPELVEYLPKAYRIFKINKASSEKCLLERCPECRRLHQEKV